MERLLNDIKFGLRLILKSPAFSIISILALGLGIGSVTTQFSIMNGAYFRGLPFEDPQELVHLERINVEEESYNTEVPIPELIEWQKQQDAFEGLAGFYSGTANVTLNGVTRRYDGAFISANAFDILGAKALYGRGLQPEDDNPESPDVIVLGYSIWQNDFGADQSVIGQTAVINGRPTTIVGIMNEGFAFPVKEQVWVPLYKQQDISKIEWADDKGMSLEVLGRLKDGVSRDQANASMNGIARRIEEAYPVHNKGFRAVEIKPYIDEILGDQTFVMMSMMLAITILILIIACTNVANLLLARSVRRSKELAIRSALGATRQGIIRQLLTESILLAVFGAGLGMTVAHYNIASIGKARMEMNMPFWFDFSLDWRILTTVTILTIATGIFSGLLPAIRASRQDFNVILKDDSRTGTSVHLGKFIRSLVIAQVTLACVILVLVVLMVRSFREASNIELVYDSEGIMSARMGLFEESYPTSESREQFLSQLITNLENRPEIESAAFTNRYRFLNTFQTFYEIDDTNYSDQTRPLLPYQEVTKNFLKTTKLPLYQGRFLEAQDFLETSPKVAVVNREMVQREWPNENPIGQRFRTSGPKGIGEDDDEEWITVVGVVGSMMEQGIDSSKDGAAAMMPMKADLYPRFITLIAGGRGNPEMLPPILREETAKLDGNLPLYAMGTPASIVDEDLAQFSFFSSIFTRFGILATFLAAVGIYGVIMFSVHQRTTEFGIRQALGATPSGILTHVIRNAMRQLLTGFAIALLILSPLYLFPNIESILSNIFYKVSPEDVINYLFAFGIVAIALILAVMPPAIRASRIQPSKALRHE